MPEQENKAPDALTRLRAEAKEEPIASFLKMQLLELSPGYAKVTIKLTPEHENFNGFVFGGIIMAVADQAFAYAVNSMSRPNIASQFNIHFIAAAKAGDELIAEGRVVKSGRRVSIAEMTVTNQEGKLIARATGTTIPVTKG
ncbi:MAG: PaaI family thioesterase [Dehalococcoidales bacterium]